MLKMNVMATLVLAAVCVVGLAPQHANDATIEGVAAYLLDGNGNDAINSYHGTVHGTATYSTDLPGLAGDAYSSNRSLSLDGTDDCYVHLGTSNDLRPSPITIEAYIKPYLPEQVWVGIVDSYDAYQMAVCKATADTFWVKARLSTSECWRELQTWPSTTYTMNAWHQIALTYDNSPAAVAAGGNFKLYMDGAEVMSADASGTVGGAVSNNQWINIGRLYDGSAGDGYSQFTGKIDEVRIVDRALSSTEMAANYSTSLNALHIRNGGFESVDGSNHPTDWAGPSTGGGATGTDYSYDDGNGNTITYSVDTTESHSGSNSLKIVATGTGTYSGEFSSNPVSIETGTEVKISGWIKTEDLVTGGGGGSLDGATLAFRGSYPPSSGWANGTLEAIKGTNDWTYFERTFVWGDTNECVWDPAYLILSYTAWNMGTGTVWFDDIQLEIVPEPATMSLLLIGLPLALRRRRK